jgi:hypothetical protein
MLASSLNTMMAPRPQDNREVKDVPLIEAERRKQGSSRMNFMMMAATFSMTNYLLSRRIFVKVSFKHRRQSTLGLQILGSDSMAKMLRGKLPQAIKTYHKGALVDLINNRGHDAVAMLGEVVTTTATTQILKCSEMILQVFNLMTMAVSETYTCLGMHLNTS